MVRAWIDHHPVCAVRVSLLQWLLGGSQFLPGSDVALASGRRYYTSEQPMQFLISTRHLDRAAYQPRLTIVGGGKTSEVEPRPRGESTQSFHLLLKRCLPQSIFPSLKICNQRGLLY